MFSQRLSVQTNGTTPPRDMRQGFTLFGSVIPGELENAIPRPISHQIVSKLHGRLANAYQSLLGKFPQQREFICRKAVNVNRAA